MKLDELLKLDVEEALDYLDELPENDPFELRDLAMAMYGVLHAQRQMPTRVVDRTSQYRPGMYDGPGSGL